MRLEAGHREGGTPGSPSSAGVQPGAARALHPQGSGPRGPRPGLAGISLTLCRGVRHVDACVRAFLGTGWRGVAGLYLLTFLGKKYFSYISIK